LSMTITSSQNQKLKEIRKLRTRRRERDRAGRFVAEGEDLLAAADAAGWEPVERYCAAGSGLAGIEVEPALLAAASGLASGTRALAVYEERWATAAIGPLCVYLHGVADPGNVGAVLRSAEAFGASCVAIGPGTADPFSPKAVRASMGSVFAVPLARVPSPGALPGATVALVPDALMSLAELEVLAAGPRGRDQSQSVRDGGDGGDGVTLLVGAEREGLPAEIAARADHTARIPIHSHSLNAAMAATVALYEVTRMPPAAAPAPPTAPTPPS
jgi:TrmH family RNA methyltransferase